MAAEAATQEQSKAAEEKQTNCLACNKPIKKIRRYYRNGKFYCTKRCWMKFIETEKNKGKEEEKK
ncbi:MAG: hypothetical protein MUC39_04110 [Candidatus Omnitrophica bacterium]|jgi:hypothetical protein|nr:hypothetical protein [Candidatus Omnitrophota bacterium]